MRHANLDLAGFGATNRMTGPSPFQTVTVMHFAGAASDMSGGKCEFATLAKASGLNDVKAAIQGSGSRPHHAAPVTKVSNAQIVNFAKSAAIAGLLDVTGPFVCVGCCSQSRIWHDFGSRSYVSGLLIGSRAVALMGLRTRRGLITGKVHDDHLGRQTLGAYFLRSMLSSLSRTPW